jgi:hypothetical protein
MHKRPDIGKPTASESDHYEELLVNPAILTLAHKRGNIDCGGLEYVVVATGTSTSYRSRRRWARFDSVRAGANPVAWADSVIDLLRNYRVTPKGTQ